MNHLLTDDENTDRMIYSLSWALRKTPEEIRSMSNRDLLLLQYWRETEIKAEDRNGRRKNNSGSKGNKHY